MMLGRAGGRPAGHGDDDLPERDRVREQRAGQLAAAPPRHALHLAHHAALQGARRHPLRHLHQVSADP